MSVSRSLSGRLILFADDDDADRELYTQVLRRAGAVVVPVDDAEAVDVVGGGVRFDAVVLDYRMPGSRGTQATVSLRVRGFDGAVVGLTAYDSPKLSAMWRAAGCDEVVHKDEGAAEAVVQAVAEACDRRSPRA